MRYDIICFAPPLLPQPAVPAAAAAWLQLRFHSRKSDPDLADPPTPLAAGAGGAAALQRGGDVTLALAGREGVQEH